MLFIARVFFKNKMSFLKNKMSLFVQRSMFLYQNMFIQFFISRRFMILHTSYYFIYLIYRLDNKIILSCVVFSWLLRIIFEWDWLKTEACVMTYNCVYNSSWFSVVKVEKQNSPCKMCAPDYLFIHLKKRN